MRIGILTLPLHTNYGGILQAYALQTVLERMGHEASVITTSNKAELPVWKWPYSYPKRMIGNIYWVRMNRFFLNRTIIVYIRL